MPRYFFNIYDGREIIDETGIELASLAEARSQAIITSGEMLKEYGLAFWGGAKWQMYVVDGAGKTVVRINFSAETRESDDG